jgi:hypothetical protein
LNILIKDNQRISKLKRALERQPIDLEDDPDTQMKEKIMQQIECIGNQDYLNSKANQLMQIKREHEKLRVDSYPVVYVIRVNPKWLEGWRERNPAEEKSGLTWMIWLTDGNLNIRANVDIPAKAIIARINFPKEMQEFSFGLNELPPPPWGTEEVNSHKTSPRFFDSFDTYFKRFRVAIKKSLR